MRTKTSWPEINLVTVERHLATNARLRTIYIRLGATAQMLLALDDPALIREAYPTLEAVGPADSQGTQTYRVTAEDAWVIASDLHERSLGGDMGFGHTPAERRVAARAHDVVRRALAESL